jgi:hypothetical protein
MTDEIDHLRRRLSCRADVAVAQLGMIRSAAAQSSSGGAAPLPAIRPGTNASFAPEEDRCRALTVGYAEAARPTVLRSSSCMAGPTTFTAMSMSPLCSASAGYRVIVPFCAAMARRISLAETPRNGQPSALAADIVALMDSLKIEKATSAF